MKKEIDYGPYDDIELYQLMNEPWEVTDRPYLLHAAYALSCLSEALEVDDEKEGNDNKAIWGKKIPERILNIVVKNAAENFNDAAQNRTKIDVWERPYTIRKQNAYDSKRLTGIFKFPLENGEYTITKNGVMKLADGEIFTFQDNKENLAKNREFLRKVVMLAEDDDNGGWDMLTDMEVAVYCWAQFYHKCETDNDIMFMEKYRDYLDVTREDIISCLNDFSSKNNRPHGLYAFDYEKTMSWNDKNRQHSVIDDMPKEKADDYWYDVALKTTFKPI